MIHSKHRYSISKFAAVVAIVVALSSGCAYYNTFYNIKRDFRAAERQTQRVLAGREPLETTPAIPGGGTGHIPGNTGTTGIPVQQYQSILQSCSKLLEFYPRSRWIDDALMVMGISYYRMDEFARAERKFTELATIFPNSKHLQMAIVWRARSLIGQEKYDEAEALLTEAKGKLTTPEAISASARTLASIYDLRGQTEEAVTYLEAIQGISYERGEKATDYLTLGRSYRALGRTDDARKALLKCINMTRAADEVFRARKILSDMSAEQGNYAEARAYLRPLETDRRFIDKSGEILLQAATVEAKAGDPARSIAMLEEFCSTAPQGELKARAYFTQGETARDKLAQFEIAQAKFDSAAGSGAPRGLQDSATYASRQLRTGLTALERIPVLQDSLDILRQALENAANQTITLPPDDTESELESDSTGGTELSVESVDNDSLEPVVADSSGPALDTLTDRTQIVEVHQFDSTIVSDTSPHSILQTPQDTLADSAATDSTGLSQVTTDTAAGSASGMADLSPAEMIADSILRSIAREDSMRKARSARHSRPDSALTGKSMESDSGTTPAKQATTAEIIASRLASVSKRLVSAHLEAAAFYETVIHNPDSAVSHIELAAEVSDSSAEHWRATVQLGKLLRKNETEQERARELLELAAHSEDAPREFRNIAREELGLEKLTIELTPQERALGMAETALLGESSMEEVLAQYREVALMDSHTVAGVRALQAIAYVQEYRLGDYSGASETHREIARLFPDSTFASISKMKLAEPDSTSIFLLSDEALSATMQPALELLTTDSDSTGWPPEESSLRGRRFQ